jgi:phosphoribosylamine-glycine ligase
MHACVIGSFSDEYDMLDFNDNYAVSCVLSSGQYKNDIIQGLDEVQDNTYISHINTKQNEYTEFETQGDRTLVVTSIANTITRATTNLYDEIEHIDFRGKRYRKDLCSIPTQY